MKWISVFILLLLGIARPLTADPSEHSTQMLIRVYYDSEVEKQRLLQTVDDIAYLGKDFFEIVCNRDEYESISTTDFYTEVLHNDLTAFYQSRFDDSRDMGGFMTLSEINTHVDSIIAENPNIVSSKISIGHTIEGRDMWAFKISDNPEVDEDETEILFTAAIHAREPISPMVLLNIVDHLTSEYGNDPEITDLVDNREIWFVPMVNPDGYYHNEVIAPGGGGMWRKNRRDNGDGTYGVDINRNFGYKWGYNNTGSTPNTAWDAYRGIGPFSEPETQNMRDFQIAHDFQIAVYFHSYANAIYGPWAYNSTYPKDFDVFTYMISGISAFNGYDPRVGKSTINGCSDDWNYGERTLKNKTYGITYEVGSPTDGFWPPTERIPELIDENLQPSMFLIHAAGVIDSIYDLRPPEQPELYLPDSSSSPDYEISWVLNDSLNPAVEYELVEQTGLNTVTDNAENFSFCINSGFSLSSLRYYTWPFSFHAADGSDLKTISYVFPKTVGLTDTLSFWTEYYLTENIDYAYVMVVDQSSGDTVTIAGNITTDSNPEGYNLGHGITGTSGGWVKGIFELSAFAGEKIKVVFAYHDNSDTYTEGFYIDDIHPVEIFETTNTLNLPGADTSYTISDKPEDNYYYRIRAKDDDNQWSRYSVYQNIVVEYEYICGDANADGEVDISDAVYLINYVFLGGPSPDPMDSGDANCDTGIDISDAYYVINFAFTGGNHPCDTDGDDEPDC